MLRFKYIISLFTFHLLIGNCSLSAQELKVSPKISTKVIDKVEFDSTKADKRYQFNSFSEDSIVSSSDRYTLRDPIKIKTKTRDLFFINTLGKYDEDIKNYYDLGYLQSIKKHLVYVSYYEYDEYLLIDDSTANIDTLIGKPFFLPDDKLILSFYLNSDGDTEIDGIYHNFIIDIEIRILCKDKTYLMAKESYSFIPTEIKWIDNNTLYLKGLKSADYDKVMSDGKMTLSDIKNFSYKSIEITKM